MASPAPDVKFNIARCRDIIGLQEYLKRLRTIDDNIISTLNSTILTSSFQKDIDQNIKNCKIFHDQLNKAYEDRDKVIQSCLADADAKLKEIGEAKNQNESDMNVQKEFKRQQTRQRMIRNELMVEQIIRDRSLKALQERCRPYGNF